MSNVAVPLILIFLLTIALVKLCTSAAIGSTLTPNQSLADGDVLISRRQTFALGFFSPGNTTRRYLGVWYNKVSEHTVAWVANRNSPLHDSSGLVSFDAAGSLILTAAASSPKNTRTPLWSANVSAAPPGSVSAQLLDTGNLVIIQEPSRRLLWQSFDYPTDTMMSFMKLGLDRKTGLDRFLTSWKGPDDPGTGSYTCRIDPSGVPQLFMEKGPARRWRGGPWNGVRWSGVPEMTSRFIFNISYVDDRDEVSIMDGILDASVFSRMVVSESGSLERSTWHESNRRWIGFWSAPRDTCDLYKQCGAYSFCDPNRDPGQFECRCLPGFRPKSPKDWYLRDGSGGCVRERSDSMCGNGEGFVKVARVKVPDTRVARVDMGASGDACRQQCLRNCSCVAFTRANVSGAGSGCLGWFGDLIDIKVYTNPNDGQDLYLRADAVELANERKRSGGGFGGAKMTTTLAIVFPTVFMVGLLLAAARCWWYKRHSRLAAAGRARMRSLLELHSGNTLNNKCGDGNEGEEGNNKINLPFFSLSEIKSATDNFSNKLGEGGFGPVYKGRIGVNGPEIAVKRLSKFSGQGVEEFKNEIRSIAMLQHRNLVKILGCCIQNEETMLIYEYMTNKSLDSFIFDSSRKAILDWRKRYEIIIGIARGILYLHRDSRLRIIHRDLKASNILLDGEMNPKISDFGMARIFGGNQTQANTNRVVGTFGYMSPEYALDGLFSMRSDIFSFGVLILEIVCGKKNLALYSDDPLSNLIRHVWELWTKGRALEMVDASMGDSWEDFEVLRCIQVGLLCVQESPTDRPDTSAVVFMLSNHQTVLAPPKQPAFSVGRINGHPIPGSWCGTDSSLCSKNEMTMTVVEPR